MFEDIDELNVKKLITKLEGKRIKYRKGATVISNISNIDEFGFLIKGSVDLIKYNLNGSITILDSLKQGEIFGSVFSANIKYSSIITTEESEIIFFNLSTILDRCIKKEYDLNILIYNILKEMNSKITALNNRIEILTQRSTREKLIKYFENESSKKASNTFVLRVSYTYLADLLSVDRSAMMREIKHLKDEGFIAVNNKRITINKY